MKSDCCGAEVRQPFRDLVWRCSECYAPVKCQPDEPRESEATEDYSSSNFAAMVKANVELGQRVTDLIVENEALKAAQNQATVKQIDEHPGRWPVKLEEFRECLRRVDPLMCIMGNVRAGELISALALVESDIKQLEARAERAEAAVQTWKHAWMGMQDRAEAAEKELDELRANRDQLYKQWHEARQAEEKLRQENAALRERIEKIEGALTRCGDLGKLAMGEIEPKEDE